MSLSASSYLDFLFYGSPPDGSAHLSHGQTIGDASPNFVRYALYCSMYFVGLSVLIPLAVRTLFPSFWRSLSEQKRFEFPSYTAGFFHHIVVAPLGIYRIYEDWAWWLGAVDGRGKVASFRDYAPNNADVLPFNIGYLVADTIFIGLPEAFQGKPLYLLHHLAAFLMCHFLMKAPGFMARFIPHLLVTEVTNLLFEAAWLLRVLGLRDSVAVTVVEVLFVVTYLLTRVVNMPLSMWALVQTGLFEQAGIVGNGVLLGLVLLQFYWFGIIMTKLLEKLGLKAKPSKRDEAAAKKD